MKIKIVRIDKSLPLPEYQTSGAVAFDIYSREAAVIQPKELKILPSNLIIEVPQGHALVLAARSSLGKKKGLVLRNAIGVIDQDFHGPNDEIGIMVFNFTQDAVSVERGERIAQGMIVPVARAHWEEVDIIKADSRGGYGSTG